MAEQAPDQKAEDPERRTLICQRYYKELKPFAEGGFAEVYRGWIAQVGTPVIVKIPKSIHCTPDKIEQTRARWQREAERPARMPFGAQRCIELTEWEGRPCLILEYVDGVSLRTYLQELGSQELSCDYVLALEIASQIVATIAEAHGQRIIHRDITPANILLSRLDEQARTVQVTLIDWGISKSLIADSPDATSAQLWTAEPPARYVAPEGTSELKEALDIYSLGVVLYELLGGLRDECRSRLHLMNDIERRGLERMSGRREVLEIVRRCLAESGTQRRSMSAIWRDLEELILIEKSRKERELAAQLAQAQRDSRGLEKKLENERQARSEVERTAAIRLQGLEDKHGELVLTQGALRKAREDNEEAAEKERHLEVRLQNLELRERNLNAQARDLTKDLAAAAERYVELERRSTRQLEGLREQVAIRDKQIDELKERLRQLPQEGFVTVDAARWRELTAKETRLQREQETSRAALASLRFQRRLGVGAIASLLVLGGAGFVALQSQGAIFGGRDLGGTRPVDGGTPSPPADQGQPKDCSIVPSVRDGGPADLFVQKPSDGGPPPVPPDTRWHPAAINGLNKKPARLLAGWADGAGTVYAVGQMLLAPKSWNGLLLRSTSGGESFDVFPSPARAGQEIPKVPQYYAVGGLADGRIVIGGSGIVLVLDKRGQVQALKRNREGGQLASAIGLREDFRGIWTDGASGFLVSETIGGMMYRLNVSSAPLELTPVPLGSGNSLIGVTGCGISIWAVGTGATVRRYDKQSEKVENFDPQIWRLASDAAQAPSRVPVEPKEMLWSVACQGKEVVACGAAKKNASGVVYYSQTGGQKWDRTELEFPCFSVHAKSSGEYLLGGEADKLIVLRFGAAGTTQRSLALTDGRLEHNIKSIVRADPHHILALDWEGKILLGRTE